MKTHPGFERKGRSSSEGPTGVLEGFIEVDDNGGVRVHASLGGGPAWEVSQGDVLYDEELAATGGKRRLVLSPGATVKLNATAQAAKLTSGDWCSPGGTSYCWDRTVLSDGTVIIIMTPKGSCLTQPVVQPSQMFFSQL